MRKKYANKSTAGRIFHKYTGFIVFGIMVCVIAGLWWYYTSDDVFFESWGCANLISLDPETLTPEESQRWHEIFKTDCKTFVIEPPE